jgi:iron complex transport system substrate-binding protein
MRHHTHCWITLFALLVSAGSAAQSTPAATGPQRIISLMPGFTEAVCMLDACPRLVGTDQYSDWPSAVKALPKLGALDEISVEAILQLRPDLILAHPGGRLNQRLRALGQHVVELKSDNLHDVHQSLQRIEHLLEPRTRGKAEALWTQATRDINAHTLALALKPNLKVYIEVDSALYAAGASSYLGEMLSLLGGQNIVPAGMPAFPKLSPEFVLGQQPDLIMQMHSSTGLEQRPGWRHLRAVQLHRVCTWPREQLNILLRPGPRIAEAAGLMASCLQSLTSAARKSGTGP